MRFDFDEAAKTLKFDEKKLVETSRILLDSYHSNSNIFSQVKETCDSILPEGVVRGSKDHVLYSFLMTVADIAVESNILYEKGRKLFKEKPYVFNPVHVFETDKDKLKIVKIGGSKILSDTTTDKTNNTDKDESKTTRVGGTKVLVAPTMDKIIRDELEHGLHKQISGKWYETCRKLVKVYDGDPRKIFNYITDPEVALRRLDVGRPLEPIERERMNTSLPRFGGFGWKTGPALLIRYINAGIISGMDEPEIRQPVDTHFFNLSIGRGITDIDSEVRKEKFTYLAQGLFKRTFKEHKVDNIDFHYAQWILGSEVCDMVDCYNKKTVDGKERLCPFSEPCKKVLDAHNYRRRGYISPQLNGY